MSLRPLGHRVLVKPDPVKPRGSDLILIPDTYSVKLDEDGIKTEQVTMTPPFSSGTVIAVGSGAEREHRIRQQAILDCLKAIEKAGAYYGTTPILSLVREDVAFLIGSSPEPEIHIGDRVAFTPHYIEVTEGDEQLLLVDYTAVIVMEEAAA